MERNETAPIWTGAIFHVPRYFEETGKNGQKLATGFSKWGNLHKFILVP